jgi:hypothetical protein
MKYTSLRTVIVLRSFARLFLQLFFRLINKGHQDSILIFDICFLLLHLTLKDEVSQISLLREPDEELPEGGFDRFLPGFISDEQARDMAWTCNSFYSAEEVGF